MLKEFKEFIQKGNVLDLAVAVVLGAAFSAIVKAVVDNILMPIISLIVGGRNFDDLFIAMDGGDYATFAAAQEAGASVLGYGTVITALINFVAIAFILFLVVKAYNSMKRKEEEKAPEPEAPKGPTQEELLTEIRDALKAR